MDASTKVPVVRSSTRGVRWRPAVFVAVLILFALLTLGVVVRSPLLTLDQDVLKLDLRQRYPEWFYPFHTFVMLGQRGPSTLVALPWFAWRAWKSRSARPFVVLVTALLMLNLSVGIVKIATGRLGPSATHQAHAVFDGGDIFPSGHVSNAVVLYGVIAMLAVGFRRTAAVAAAVLAISIGLTTIYLDTHWFTDVLGGWLAGSLVLLALPWVTPYAEQMLGRAIGWARRAVDRVRPHGHGEALPHGAPGAAVPVRPATAHVAPAAAPLAKARHRAGV